MAKPLALIRGADQYGGFRSGPGERSESTQRGRPRRPSLPDRRRSCRLWRRREGAALAAGQGNRRSQNLSAVVEAVRETAQRVERALAADHLPLVIGGDCTIELGTVAGLLRSGERPGLLYFDVHPDLNVPGSVREGALDWMGVAHMLGEEGAAELLSRVGPRFPMLGNEDVFLFSYGPEQATGWERDVIERRGLENIPVGEVAKDPERAAERALAQIESYFDRLLVHFDVDTVDFTDLPLSENTGRNEGLPFETAVRALSKLLKSNSLAAVTITEFNPTTGVRMGPRRECWQTE